jgi:transmembrane sensor
MNNPDSSSMNTQIYEEASEWIIQHREADLDESAKREFDAWLRRSPEHVRAYLEMSSIWEDVSSLDPTLNPSTKDLIARARTADNVVPLDATGASQAPRQVAAAAENPAADAIPVSVKVRKNLSRRQLLAASIAIACVGAGTFAWLDRYPDYSTGIGEQRSITLADGSSIDLNARSRIQIRFSEHERDIDLLEGQALFRVAKDKSRPFVVHSEGAAVRAVGTEFDVYQKKSGTTVTVLEGRVSVLDTAAMVQLARKEVPGGPDASRSGPQRFDDPAVVSGPPARTAQLTAGGPHAVFLSAGQQLTVTPATISQPAPANIAAATGWTQHRLVFDSATLSDVAEEFNRYNARQLIITDTRLSNIHISGAFSSVDPALFLRFLRAQSEIAVEETGKEIRISKK